MRIEIRERAGEHDRFTPTAFDNRIGSQVPLIVHGVPQGQGTLVAAKVSDGGAEVLFTFDVDEECAARLARFGVGS